MFESRGWSSSGPLSFPKRTRQRTIASMSPFEKTKLRPLCVALLAAVVLVVAAAPMVAQVDAVGEEPSLDEKEKPDDPSEPALEEIDSVIEDAAGDVEFDTWTEEKFAFRRVVTLVPVPQL